MHQMKLLLLMNGHVLKGLLEEEVSVNCGFISVIFRDESELRVGVM